MSPERFSIVIESDRLSWKLLCRVFFDTIGLYDKPNLHQRETAEKWCAGDSGIIEYRDREFPGLSAGDSQGSAYCKGYG